MAGVEELLLRQVAKPYIVGKYIAAKVKSATAVIFSLPRRAVSGTAGRGVFIIFISLSWVKLSLLLFNLFSYLVPQQFS